MADRTCIRCGTVFPKPFQLRRHEARKTPCAPIIEVGDLSPEILEDPNLAKKKCRFCGRVFSSYDSMRRHVRESCQIAPNEKNGDGGMELLYEHTLRRQVENQQSEIAELKEQNTKMMAMMQQLVQQGSAAPGIHIEQNNHDGVIAVDNSTNVDNRVIVNVFGREDAGHITRDQVKDILDSSMQATLPEAAQQAILKAALLIYSDSNHPENLTCYIPNKKTSDALVHVSRDGMPVWEVQPCKLVLSPMAQKGIDTLFDKQPFENADAYEALMADLRDNERKYAAGVDLKPVLVRNKDLLAKALGSLPRS